MLALPLLLALTVTAEPVAEPVAAPAAAPAAETAPGVEEEGPQIVVAPADLPAAAPEAPAAPFVLTGFQPEERVVVGAAVRLGGSSRGLDGGAEFTARHRGFVAGATIGGAAGADALRTLGLVAGYGHARGHYRGEALLGWGKVSDDADAAATRVGHFRSAQASLERAVCGGEAWRAGLGVALWWRETFGLAGAPTGHSEVGGGLRLSVEAGW